MNLQDWTPLAEGRVSNVFVSKDKLVLKLLHKTVPDWKVDDEFRRCQIITKAGVLSPRAFEIVEVEGRRGIIFEWAGERDLMKSCNATWTNCRLATISAIWIFIPATSCSIMVTIVDTRLLTGPKPSRACLLLISP